jgi:hypothetical protein
VSSQIVPYVRVPEHGGGRNPAKWFPAYRAGAHAKRLCSEPGAGGAPTIPAYCGSWSMLATVGCYGNDQGATSECFGFSSKKAFGLFQYGQSGDPIEMSAAWCYGACLSEIRRLELGGNPTTLQLEQNPLQDLGSEPSAGFSAFRRFGIAPESKWSTPDAIVPSPSGGAGTMRELDVGGVLAGNLWLPEAAGFESVVAVPGPAMTLAVCGALSPFANGKLGQSCQVSVASSTPAFDGADGSRPLLSTDFNGSSYDHSVALIGFAQASLLGFTLSAEESPSGLLFLLANSWALSWGQKTQAPTAQGLMPMAGCAWVSEKSVWGMADWATVVAAEAA